MENVGQGTALPSVSNIRKLCKRTWWVFLLGGIASVIFALFIKNLPENVGERMGAPD